MSLLLTGGTVFLNGRFQRADLEIHEGRIVSISDSLPRDGHSVVELNELFVVPGFVDVHVHLREPGFSYKETIVSGTAAAAAGGYTAVCAMANLNPVPDTAEHLRVQLDLIDRDACVRVYPYGAVTRGEAGETLADLTGMAPDVAGFSDDGKGVQSDEMMRRAMELARTLDRPIVAHCEDNRELIPGGCVHAGRWAEEHGFPGISSESEWKQVERDLKLVREARCRYHVCHVSTRESVELIRRAKEEGLRVSCETAPHYLVLCEDDLRDEGRFKMNPPLRSAADRKALIAGLLDGTIDCIATDHAPHSAQEKAGGLRESLFGIVGLETAFPVLYTALVEPGILSLPLLLEKLCLNPRRLFGLPGGIIEPGAAADLTVLDLKRPHVIDPERFRSLGRATPFSGRRVSAAVAMTLVNGTPVYSNLPQEEMP